MLYISSINEHFSPSSPPLEIFLVRTSSWWELSFPHPWHAPILSSWLPGGVSPSAYEICLATSAQTLQPRLPSSPATPGSNGEVHSGLFLSTPCRAPRNSKAVAMPFSPSPSRAAGRSFPCTICQSTREIWEKGVRGWVYGSSIGT